MTKLHHLGSAPVSHSFWYASTRNKLIRCYSLLDVSTINLNLCVFPWARLRPTTSLHVALDHDRLLPAFMTIIDVDG